MNNYSLKLQCNPICNYKTFSCSTERWLSIRPLSRLAKINFTFVRVDHATDYNVEIEGTYLKESSTRALKK